MPAGSCFPRVKACKDTISRHCPGETAEPQAQSIPGFYYFCTEGTSFNPRCLSQEVPEHITAEQALPRNANDWGAQEWAGEAGGGELRWWGLPCVCVDGAVFFNLVSPLGGYTIDYLLSVRIWGYDEFLLGAARRQTQQIS